MMGLPRWGILQTPKGMPLISIHKEHSALTLFVNVEQIWDLQKKICVEALEGHANRVSAVCSHPELPILMTGSRDGTVRLWNSNSFRYGLIGLTTSLRHFISLYMVVILLNKCWDRIHMGWLMAVTLLMFCILPGLRAYSTLVSEKSMP